MLLQCVFLHFGLAEKCWWLENVVQIVTPSANGRLFLLRAKINRMALWGTLKPIQSYVYIRRYISTYV